MKSVDSFRDAMTGFTERNDVQFKSFRIAAMVMIISRWLSTLLTSKRQWTWHSTTFDPKMDSLSRSILLRFSLPVVFEILPNMLPVLALPIERADFALFFSAFVSFSFVVAILFSQSLPSVSFRTSMAFQPIFSRRDLANAHITRGTQSFGLMSSFTSTSLTNDNPSHTVIIA